MPLVNNFDIIFSHYNPNVYISHDKTEKIENLSLFVVKVPK